MELHYIVVAMHEVGIEVDHIISHGVDLASTLELEVHQVSYIKINAKDGAGI